MIGAEFTEADIAATVARGGLLSLEIEPSLACNFHCRYCYNGSGASRAAELSYDELRDVIRQAKALGARKIIVLGGEPMIYPRIMELLAFIRGESLAAEMFTNGTGVTGRAARQLHDLGVQVVLKMNSFDDAIQDELAGFKGAAVIIRSAFEALTAAGFPAPGRPLAVSTVICARNLPEIRDLWIWLRDRGITPYFEIITPQGNAREGEPLEVAPAVLRRVFEELAALDRERYGQTWDPQPPLVGDRCLRHQFSCLVNATGTVMPCVGVTIPLGNVRERPLAGILRDSEVVQDLRRYRQTLRGPCAECERAPVCYGCRGAAYQLTGDYRASDPLCWHNAGKLDRIPRLPQPVEGLLPQAPPMRLVDRLVAAGEREADVERTLGEGDPFLGDDGALEPVAYLELIAQAAAVMHGFRARDARGTGMDGYLIGARDLAVHGEARRGDTVRIQVKRTTQFGDFVVVGGKVWRGEVLLAAGEVKVWQRGQA
jgi:radical SAM protein with 4Fe4S-binding SPASM domain